LYYKPAFTAEYLGVYSTKPFILDLFSKVYPETMKKITNHLTWELEVTENEIKVWMDKDEQAQVMPYTVDGDFLLAVKEVSHMTQYIPFYIEDNFRIHGMNTVFIREKIPEK
jgi:hypothetical protein